MINEDFTFPKREHLKSRKKIQQLFSNGQSCAAYPLRLVWIETSAGEARIQMAVSVSKRKFKTAVDRNRIKRQLREVWRLHKASIIQQVAQQDQYYACMLLYTAHEQLPYAKLEKSIKRILQKWQTAITTPQEEQS